MLLTQLDLLLTKLINIFMCQIFLFCTCTFDFWAISFLLYSYSVLTSYMLILPTSVFALLSNHLLPGLLTNQLSIFSLELLITM